MAVELNISGNPLEVEVKDYQIEGKNYRVHTWYTGRTGWNISLYNTVDETLLTGITIINELSNLTWKYSRKTSLLFNGDLFSVNKKGDYTSPLTSDNFGEDKDWGIIYLTVDEQKELGINKR